MSAKTPIGWTDSTWSTLRARVKDDAGKIATDKGYTSLVQIATEMQGRVGQHCEHVSPGCKHCYSGTTQKRCLPANGTGLPFDRRSRDLIDAIVDEKALILPLKWGPVVIHEPGCPRADGVGSSCRYCHSKRTRRRRIFVENQSDLFGEWYSDEQIDRVFAVMSQCQQHDFQVLTKRIDRALEYLSHGNKTAEFKIIGSALGADGLPHYPGTYMVHGGPGEIEVYSHPKKGLSCWAPDYGAVGPGVDDETEGHNSVQMTGLDFVGLKVPWPLPNVWLGVSCEDQATADARIPLLLRTIAAKRFVSYEPALGPVNFDPYLYGYKNPPPEGMAPDPLNGAVLDWIIVGGESGPGARPFDLQWARNTVAQCREAGVACFVKQLGAKPFSGHSLHKQIHHRSTDGNLYLKLKHRAGADPAEWPEPFPQEFPC